MIDELKKRKKNLKLTYETISAESGVPISTIQKIFAGKTKSPRIDTLEKIRSVIEYHEKMNIVGYNYGRYDDYNTYVREKALDYYPDPKPHNKFRLSDYAIESFERPFTVEDYFNMPDNFRVELIDGRIYDMTAPSNTHQSIVAIVNTIFINFIFANKSSCRAWPSPINVQLDQDDDTMLEPDFVVVCRDGDDDERLKDDKLIFGAPDFIMEVLSPSTILMDTMEKYRKYKNAGVREYWIVDPGRKKITVHHFEKGTVSDYSFDDEVPVGITGGKLIVDFKQVKEYLDW